MPLRGPLPENTPENWEPLRSHEGAHARMGGRPRALTADGLTAP